MQFSDTTDNLGLLQDIDFICETDSTSYPTDDKVRNGNRWLYKAVIWAIRANRFWQYDDSNHTDHPIVTADLVGGQQDYTVPTTLMKLNRVEVKDSSGDYRLLKHVDESEINQAMTEFRETNGLPRFYDMVGESIFLYPAPDANNVTTSGGLKLHFIREVDAFTSSDTTQEPGIAEPFHRIVSLGAAYDWLVVHSTQDKADRVRQEIEQMKNEMYEFYNDLNTQVKPHIRPLHRQEDFR